ncbi:MAG: nucleotidyltransferase domain-containing protein [Terriglobales bacterium]
MATPPPAWEIERRVTPEKIAAVVERLAAFARPSRIVIFGSAARDELRSTSDLDVLVIMHDEVKDWRAESVRMRQQVLDIDVPLDLFVVDEAEAAWKVHHPVSMVGEWLRTGKVVYEAAK